jgi:hypothetical protein
MPNSNLSNASNGSLLVSRLYLVQVWEVGSWHWKNKFEQRILRCIYMVELSYKIEN